MTRYSKDDKVNNRVQELLREGWSARWSGKHPKLTAPNGRHLTVPSSPSDGRAAKNFLADVRRMQAASTTSTTEKTMTITTNLNISNEASAGIVVLGFGPQPMDFLSKTAKLCGKGAVMDSDVARMAGANLAGGTPAALAALRERLEPGALHAEQLRHRHAPAGAVAWLANGERGMSSEALFTRLSGIKTSGRADNSHPYDPADLRRCRLMLEAVPSLQENLAQAFDLSPTWANLIGAWSELCALMDEEAPDWRAGSDKPARRLYARMKQLQGREA